MRTVKSGGAAMHRSDLKHTLRMEGIPLSGEEFTVGEPISVEVRIIPQKGEYGFQKETLNLVACNKYSRGKWFAVEPQDLTLFTGVVYARRSYIRSEFFEELRKNGIPMQETLNFPPGAEVFLRVKLHDNSGLSSPVRLETFKVVLHDKYAKGAWTTVAVRPEDLQAFQDQTLENGG